MPDRDRGWGSRSVTRAAFSLWTARACHGLAAGVLAVLTLSYLLSDRHWLGAAWGVWPSWFWSPGLVVLALLGHRGSRRWFTIALLAATAAFCLVFSEGWLVVRRANPVARHVFREARRQLLSDPANPHAAWPRGIPLRVVSWNVAALPGGPEPTLGVLAKLQPDVCFVQEAWYGERDLPQEAVEKHLPGFRRFAEPDCALLSRYPAAAREPIDLGGICAQVVAVEVPGSRTVTCVNVHLPLLPLRLAVHRRAVRDESRKAVAERAGMIARLAAAVRDRASSGPVIVAGDWNTPASAGSLRPLRARLDDAFRRGGSGWGNTMTSDFPVARIDAVFLSQHFDVVYCAAHTAKPSDHRLVEAELWLRSRE